MRKQRSSLLCWAAAALVGTLSTNVQAQKVYYPWRVFVGPRFGFNIKLDYRATPIIPGPNAGPSSGGAVDRFYDDGFVRVDAGGNQNDKTWFWGYQDPSQVDLAQGVVLMHAMSSQTTVGAKGVDDDPQPGGEITVQRIVGIFGGAYWGVEAGGLYHDVSIKDERLFPINVTVITDSYALGGIVPPVPPYSGTFLGPGPTISSVPVRTSETLAGTLAGSHWADATVLGARFGPFLEVPMGEPLSLQLSGGMVLSLWDVEFGRDDVLILQNGSRRDLSFSKSQTDWLVGGYVRGQVTLDFTERFGVYAAAEYHALQELSMRAGPYKVRLTGNDAVYAAAGFRIKF